MKHKIFTKIAITVLLFSIFITKQMQASATIDSISAFIENLIQKNQWVDNLLDNTALDLPIALKRSFGNAEYILALKKIEFQPNGASIDVYLRVNAPPTAANAQTYLYFGAFGIPWSESGGFTSDEIRLALLSDIEFKCGNYISLAIRSCPNQNDDCIENPENSLTYASIDCSGLKNISLNADLIFSKDILLPYPCDNAAGCGNVSTNINIQLENWTDLLLDINMPSFVLTKLPDWRFNVDGAVFDFSSAANSPITTLPEEYMQTYYATSPQLWRGVYFKNISIETPDFFKATDPSVHFFIEAKDMIIDEMGFTGDILAVNIIPKDAVTIGKWGISLDSLNVVFRTNNLIRGGITGGVQIPIDEAYIGYTGIIGENSFYHFAVNLEDSLSLTLWKVMKLDLEPNSFLKFEKNEDDVFFQAFFHGEISFTTNQSDNNFIAKYLKLDGLSFTDMNIQNKYPYFSVGNIGYDTPIHIANFSAQIDNIGFTEAGNNLHSFSADIGIGLTTGDDGGYRGACGFSLLSKLTEENGKQKWKYEDFILDKISIGVDNSTFAFNGYLELFHEDYLYGDGFAGAVQFQLKQMSLNLQLAATFGRKEDFKYWFVDGLADFGKMGIPLFAGVQLSGFSGGAYQHMKMLPQETYYPNTSPGVSSSGVKYVPDKNIGLGLKAGVIISLQSNPDILNGSAELELVFNSNGGLNRIGITGAVKAMAMLKDNYLAQLAEKTKKLGITTEDDLAAEQSSLQSEAAITARAYIGYDFENQALTGMLSANIDAGFLTGSGVANLYFSSSKWFIHIGKPSSRFQVSLKLGQFNVGAGVYLMAGHDIPAMPPPPNNVLNMLSSSDIAQLEQGRGINQIENGHGFCFGTNLYASTGDLKFLIFYGNLSANLGFDFMLKNYGGLHCQGSNEVLGMNGWYASGQAYSYLGGVIGIDIKLFGIQRKLEILSLQTAALLEAQLPHPSWFGGKIGFEYRVLNGLLKGKCNFKFDIGEKCVIETGSVFDNINIIADVRPHENEAKVDVYALPQSAFNLKIGTFNMDNKSYRLDLDKFAVCKNNVEIPATLTWNEENTVFTCSPDEILEANTDYIVKVEVSAKEKINGNYVLVDDGNGNPQKEMKNINFKTDNDINYIPISAVKYCYPVMEHQNYYSDESHEGYITFYQGFSSLFNDNNFDFFIKLSTSGGESIYKELVYNVAEKRITWTMPQLVLSKDYSISIVKKTKETSTGSNIVQSETEVLNDGENTINQTITTLESTVSQAAEKELLTYTFKTSDSRLFSEAMSKLAFSKASRHSLLGYNDNDQYYSIPIFSYLTINTAGQQKFDNIDKFGSQYTNNQALIEVSAIKNFGEYMTNIDENLYSYYNFDGLVNWGNRYPPFFPNFAVYAIEANNPYQFPWSYNLPIVFVEDHQNIKTQLVHQTSLGNNISPYEYLLLWDLPIIPVGQYEVKMRYRLPFGQYGSEYTVVYDL